MKNSLFTPSIIIESPAPEMRQQELKLEKKQIDSEEILRQNALTRAPNIKKPNGKVNCEGLYGEGVVAVTVSPLNKKFKSQIDDGVWPFVERLIELNYMTMSSCQGHPLPGGGDHFHFLLATPSLEYAEELKKIFESVPYFSVIIKNSVSNVSIKIKNNSSYGFEVEKNVSVDLEEEYRDINYMYFRNYEKYWFVDVALLRTTHYLPWSFSSILHNIIYRLKFNYAKKRMLKLLYSNKLKISPY